MRILLPSTLSGRFSLILIAALLFCNLAAAYLLAREGSNFDAAIRVQSDMGRLVALVQAVEESDRVTGEAILNRTNTGYTRFSIDMAPLSDAGERHSDAVTSAISVALPNHDVRAIRGTGNGLDPRRGPELTILSVHLRDGPRSGEWLNSLVYPLGPTSVWSQKWAFFVPLFASLASALLVGLWTLRQVTHPLKDLAQASLAAGEGDHSLRLSEYGPKEIREVAIAFNTMQRQIAAFEAERQQLLASVGHDLRTPLTALRLRAEIVEEKDHRRHMSRLLEEMSVMVEDILTWTHAAATSEPFATTDLEHFLAELCADRDLPYRRGQPRYINIQPVSMRRAIGNLIENGQRYAYNVEVQVSLQTDAVTIIIQDRGPGISEDKLQTVLRPFVRADDSRNVDTGGYGLGLAIADRIIANHGGTLQLRNRRGGGLGAEVRLPVSAQEG